MGIKSIISALTPSNIAYYTVWGYVSYKVMWYMGFGMFKSISLYKQKSLVKELGKVYS
jgi:hypothetical protein